MKEKNKKMRDLLLLRANEEKVRKELEKEPTNPDLWYKLGMALADNQGAEASIEAISQGISLNPFNPLLYFGRGRRYIGLRKFWECISDMTLAISLEPEITNHWYYRAVAYNLNGNYELALADFKKVYHMSQPEEHYPIVDWIFLTYIDLEDRENAKLALELIDLETPAPQMDYSYSRRLMLYKGLISPEDLLDIKHIKEHCLDVPNRVQLTRQTLTFGLYVYYEYIKERDKANETLLKISEFEASAAFGYLKGVNLAKKRGLID